MDEDLALKEKKTVPVFLKMGSNAKKFRLFVLFSIIGTFLIFMLKQKSSININWNLVLYSWICLTFGAGFSFLQKHFSLINALFGVDNYEINGIEYMFGVFLMITGIMLLYMALI